MEVTRKFQEASVADGSLERARQQLQDWRAVRELGERIPAPLAVGSSGRRSQGAGSAPRGHPIEPGLRWAQAAGRARRCDADARRGRATLCRAVSVGRVGNFGGQARGVRRRDGQRAGRQDARGTQRPGARRLGGLVQCLLERVIECDQPIRWFADRAW